MSSSAMHRPEPASPASSPAKEEASAQTPPSASKEQGPDIALVHGAARTHSWLRS